MTLRSEVGMQLSLLQRRQPKASQSEKTIRCRFCLNTQKPIVRARAAWLLAFPGAKVKLLKSKGRTGSSWARFGEPYAFEKRVQLLNWGSPCRSWTTRTSFGYAMGTMHGNQHGRTYLARRTRGPWTLAALAGGKYNQSMTKPQSRETGKKTTFQFCGLWGCNH